MCWNTSSGCVLCVSVHLSRRHLPCWGKTWPSCPVCWRSWSSCGEVSRKPWNKMKRPRSIRVPSLALSCPSISRPLRYIHCSVVLLYFLYIYFCPLNKCKQSWFVFQDERATVPLIQLASFMPPTAVPMFRWAAFFFFFFPDSDFYVFVAFSFTKNILGNPLLHPAFLLLAVESCLD